MVSKILLLLVSCALSCQGYKIFQGSIPNGDAIPHPCKTNYVWQGVGHQNVMGGGVRNPFGQAFDAAGKSWTADLCNADSDGDGKTNGEELGDPGCTWTAGEAPTTTTGLSHPGVCEPTNSTECLALNSWEIDCSDGADFECPGLDHPDTIAHEMKFTRTAVPAATTTYICQQFDVPSDREYHLFAMKPIIDNQNIMHHTIVYGCKDGIEGYETPKECGMAQDICTVMLEGWTLGSNGGCQRETDGFLIGKGHFTRVIMEHHWNNPTNEVNYYDESGMTMYLTPNLRQNNLGFLITGQVALVLPPTRISYSAEGTCSGSCVAKKIDQPIYITQAHLHMHYLGASGSIEHWRDGKLVSKWFSEEVYSYDTPVFVKYDPPIEFRPGDSIVTKCNYNTMDRDEITYMGSATADEMCFGFMNYYPADAGFDLCVSYEGADMCDLQDYRELDAGETSDNKDNSAPAANHSSIVMLVVMAMSLFQ